MSIVLGTLCNEISKCNGLSLTLTNLEFAHLREWMVNILQSVKDDQVRDGEEQRKDVKRQWEKWNAERKRKREE